MEIPQKVRQWYKEEENNVSPQIQSHRALFYFVYPSGKFLYIIYMGSFLMILTPLSNVRELVLSIKYLSLTMSFMLCHVSMSS